MVSSPFSSVTLYSWSFVRESADSSFFLQTVLIGNNGCTGVTHCIGYKTAVHGDDPGVFGAGDHGKLTFFTVDTREAGIRCETAGKLFCYLIVVIHTFGTCFLVAAHDQADSFVQLHAVVAEKLHGIERFQDRAFVISGPAAVYMIVFTGKAERIVGPVSAYQERYPDDRRCRRSHRPHPFRHNRSSYPGLRF